MTGLKPRLLIVHQNLNMAKTLARLLAKDYDVFISQEAGNAPDLLDKNGIRLVIASQQLPDTTGMSFFAELRKTRPDIIRVLLFPKNYQDTESADGAIGDGIIHRYMVEPLSSSGFVEMVHSGFQIHQRATGGEPGEGAAPGGVEAESAERAGGEAGSIEAASQSYADLTGHQARHEELEKAIEEKDRRIERLEASNEHLKREKEDAQTRLIRARKENAALGEIKIEKEKIEAENSRLIDENKRIQGNADALEERVRELETELDDARRKLDSFGVLAGEAGGQTRYTAHDLREAYDTERIYEQAAEWCSQMAQLKRLHGAMSIKNQRNEQEISELNESLVTERQRHEEELGRLRRQLREYREQIARVRDRLDEQDKRSKMLLKENEDLAQKMDWMQHQWKEAAASSSKG